MGYRGIVQLEESYLLSGDESLLAGLYEEITRLAKRIAGTDYFPWVVQSEDIHDLATSVVMRLMETKQLVIKRAPSCYVRNALFFAQKAKVDRGASCDSLFESIEFSDDPDSEDRYQYLANWIADDAELPEDVDRQVRQCLCERQPFEKFRKTIKDRNVKLAFSRAMKEIKHGIEEDLFSAGLLPADRLQSEILPRTSASATAGGCTAYSVLRNCPAWYVGRAVPFCTLEKDA